jgi:hypothetical protein
VPRTVTSIRLDAGERLLLDRAAAAQHKSLGAYLRAAGLAAAAQQRIAAEPAPRPAVTAALVPGEQAEQAEPTSLYALNAPLWDTSG